MDNLPMRPHLRLISRPPANPRELAGEAIALMTKLRGILNSPAFPGPRPMRDAIVARSAEDEMRLRSLIAVGGDDGPRAA
jgi:hypothetical protein